MVYKYYSIYLDVNETWKVCFKIIFFSINIYIRSYTHFNNIFIYCIVKDHKTKVRECLENSEELREENGLKLIHLIKKAFEEGDRKIGYGTYGGLISQMKEHGNSYYNRVIDEFLSKWMSVFSSNATVEKLIKYLKELSDNVTAGIVSCYPIYFSFLVAGLQLIK